MIGGRPSVHVNRLSYGLGWPQPSGTPRTRGIPSCNWPVTRELPSRAHATGGTLGHHGGMPPPRILVVEDDKTIGDALVVALRGEGYEVHLERDGEGGLRAAETFRADLAILDVRLPAGPSGIDIAVRLRQAGDTAILFLTAADAAEERLAGFGAGADDYVVKPFLMAELLARLRALLRRTGRLASAVWQVGELVVDEAARVALVGDVALELTRTEFELLMVLVRHRGQILSKGQLLSLVWGYDSYDPNVVEVRLSALRRKLEASLPGGEAPIRTVRGMGYVIGP